MDVGSSIVLPAETAWPVPRADAPPTPEAESQAFWNLRMRLLSTLFRQALEHSRLRIVLVLGLSAGLWMGLFLLCVEGFHFLRLTITFRDTYDQTVRAVFGMFFGALMVMLIFSSAIILYSALFRSEETSFLLSLPIRAERIFLHKFQEAVVFSSWGFLLLGSPMLFAYGLVATAPWYYYVMLFPYMAAFVYIPASIGALTCLTLVRLLPRARTVILILLLVGLIAAAIGYGWSIFGAPRRDLLTIGWLHEILGRLRFTEQRLLPSWWLSSGLLEASRYEWSESTLFLTLLISNALFFRQLSLWTAASQFRPAYSALCAAGEGQRRAGGAWVDHAVGTGFHRLPLPMRLLIVKDFRLFRRDPMQWSQFLIFFGLLALYFVNIRRFSYDIHYVGWVNMVSFLNLSVVGLLLSTFNTRFIFPMISLEGRRFWVLGLLPVHRDTIMWAKFLFALGGSIVPSCLLVLLSDAMLRVTPAIIVSHQVTCLLLSVGLSGIAVGLGAKLPNLREQSPSRIAAGFGGTLNLVISTLYIVAVVLLTALPWHFQYGFAGLTDMVSQHVEVGYLFQVWLSVGTAASILLTFLATALPMRIGLRAFRRLEF